MTSTIGILSYGAYVPRRRLQRATIYAANAWFAPGLRGIAKGERAVANWDEDPVTMGVEAARDCVDGTDRQTVAALTLASVTHSFADRLNAGIVKEALNLSDAVIADDRSGSLRAGTSALGDALAGSVNRVVVAADLRKARAASDAELTQGDAAAAILVGKGDHIATLVSSHTITVDFVDHYREAGEDFDYHWETRWIRQEGHGGILTDTIRAALARAGLEGAAIHHAIIPLAARGAAASVAKGAGIPAEAVADTLAHNVGDSGTAHPLLMLCDVLDRAQPGERILVASFGQGADVLILEVMPAIAAVRRGRLAAQLARRVEDSNYMRFLAHRGVVEIEKGMRAEYDEKQSSTTLYRNRKAVLGLVGGRCTHTGTVQFPPTDIGVNPNDRSRGTQEPYPLAERPARVLSFTADNLTYSFDPPNYYGTVDFEGGGRVVTEFAEIEPGEIDVGTPVRMVFRIKSFDPVRKFRKYFWKAVPINKGDA